MRRIWAMLIFVIALAFALPALVNAFMAIIPAVIAGVFLVGIGTLLFQRRRRW